MNSRQITDLHPAMQPLANTLVSNAAKSNFQLLIYCTWRDAYPDQAALYAQGRTAPGPIVTDAPPNESAHNFGLALDACPMFAGKPVWSETDPLWKTYGQLVIGSGLEWAGTPGFPFREFPHAEMPNWRAFINNPVMVNA